MSGVTTGEGGAKPTPTAAELDEMSPEELARLATELDDVVVQHNAPKFPIPGTRAEKRAERAVAFWFGLSAIAALAFVVAFIAWPHEYRPPADPGYTMYSLYTPAVGITFGLAVLSLGVGVITYVRKFFPEEVSVQQRHDGRSDEVARRTVMAQLASAGKDTTIARRSLIKRSAGAAAGLFGIGLGIAAIGPLIRNPWKDGPDSPLWVTGWKSTNGESTCAPTPVSSTTSAGCARRTWSPARCSRSSRSGRASGATRRPSCMRRRPPTPRSC